MFAASVAQSIAFMNKYSNNDSGDAKSTTDGFGVSNIDFDTCDASEDR